MKSDTSRFTFDPKKHYASVRMQQGRVLLDAEGTEQSDILNHRIETEAKDVIGGCGGPMHNAAFEILGSRDDVKESEKKLTENNTLLAGLKAPDFLIGKGRYYVDGILCINEKLTSYLHQPDLPRYNDTIPPVIDGSGKYLVYVDVWQRLLTALDDPSIREVALGGADTTARVKTVWQIRLLKIAEPNVSCNSKLLAFEKLIAPSDGQMSARTKPPGANDDPCIVPPGAGYTGLENQLYRVEIHDGGQVSGGRQLFELGRIKGKKNQVKVSGNWNVGEMLEFITSGRTTASKKSKFARVVSASVGRGGTTLTLDSDVSVFAEDLKASKANVSFKWSRDNGAVVTGIREISGDKITVHDLGRDDLGFTAGQWVEISDDSLELNGLPGQMARITDVDSTTNVITLSAAVSMKFNAALNPKVRRWDGFGAVDPSDNFVDLENSVQVRFFEGKFRTGDYWTIAARTATADEQAGNIEWPVAGGTPRQLLPFGIEHHYCRLAILTLSGEKFTVEDCRNLFPPITELTSFAYIGGTGQESMPGEPLPETLKVGVFNGQWPVAGAQVKFTTSPEGKLARDLGSVADPNTDHELTVRTDENGIASCAWMLDPAASNPKDPKGRSSQIVQATLLASDGQPTARVITFTGNLSLASEVFYHPGDCPELKAKNVNTVQAAIDHLCQVKPGGGCCDVTVGKDGEFQELSEAIERLRERGHTDICICLLPGEHRVKKPLVVSDSAGKIPVTHLKISGCGLATRVVFEEGGIELNLLSSFTLRDIAMSTTKTDRFIQCQAVNEINIDNCYLYALGPGLSIRPTLLTIERAKFISITGSTLNCLFEGPEPIQPVRDLNLNAFSTEPMAFAADEIASLLSKSKAETRNAFTRSYDALTRSDRVGQTERAIAALSIKEISSFQPDAAGRTSKLSEAVTALYHGNALALLDAGADTLIENNRFTGRIMLYGNSDWITADEWKTYAKKIQKGTKLTELGGTLQVRNNLLTGISLDRRVIQNGDKLSGVYSRCLLSDNWCYFAWHHIVAAQLNITSNQFNWGQSGAFEAATVAGRSAVIVGNEAPNPSSQLFHGVQVAPQAGFNLLKVDPLV